MLLFHPYGFQSCSLLPILLFCLLQNPLIVLRSDIFASFLQRFTLLFRQIVQHSLFALLPHGCFLDTTASLLDHVEIHREDCSFLIPFIVQIVIVHDVFDNAHNLGAFQVLG